MKEIVEVKREGKGPSRIIVGDVLEELSGFLPEKRVIVITDSNVHRRYGKVIEHFDHIIIGMGETNKTLVTMEKIYHELIEMDADRECFILGFGGGIVTDVAGFAASTFMRGLSFGFIASTLLAQVDASVGGKNGVNMEGYKNMVGTFNQPDFVLCDTSLLRTLPEREFRAGLAEIIKAGIIADPELFELFENHSFEDFRNDGKLLTRAITAAIKVKAGVVERDEREAGERKLLNLGHTFGHAVEKSTHSFLHGEAVAIGIAMACDLSVMLGIMAHEDAAHIKGVIERMGLPLESGVDAKRLMKVMKHDKKRDREYINMVLPIAVGKCEIRRMPIAELESIY